MGELFDRLTADMKTAMKAGEKERLSVVRLLINGIKNERDDVDKDLSDEQEMAVLLRAVKSRKDSVAQAEEHDRPDIAEKERAEIELIETYLPEQMSPEELSERVRQVAEEVGYSGPRDTGRFMGVWMSRYKGLADGRAVQDALKKL